MARLGYSYYVLGAAHIIDCWLYIGVVLMIYLAKELFCIAVINFTIAVLCARYINGLVGRVMFFFLTSFAFVLYFLATAAYIARVWV